MKQHNLSSTLSNAQTKSTRQSLNQRVTNSNFQSPKNLLSVTFDQQYTEEGSTDQIGNNDNQRYQQQHTRARTQLKNNNATIDAKPNAKQNLTSYGAANQTMIAQQAKFNTMQNSNNFDGWKGKKTDDSIDLKRNYEINVQSIVYKFSEPDKARVHSIDVNSILENQKRRKMDMLSLGKKDELTNVIKENMKMDHELFQQELDQAFDMNKSPLNRQANTNKRKSLIKFPSITNQAKQFSQYSHSEATTPKHKNGIRKTFNLGNGYLDTGMDLDPALLGQNIALKNKDIDKFKKIQNRQLEFSIDKLQLSEEGEQEMLDAHETQSYVNEIELELLAIEKEIGEQNQKQQKLDKVQETFTKLREFCQQQLSYSYKDVNLHINNLLKKNITEVSPLLKFYNELAQNTNFRLPLKSLLEFDTKVFMRHMEKSKKAHEVEIKWVKKAARDKANETLRRDYEKTKDQLVQEIFNILEQFNQVQYQLDQTEQKLKKSDDLVLQQEQVIVELSEYIRFTDQKVIQLDEELVGINQGTEMAGGQVNDKINQLHERMIFAELGKAKKLDKEPLLKTPFNHFSSYILLSKESSEQIMEREIIEYYRALAVELKDEVELKENENSAQRFILDEFIKSETVYQKQIEKLNNQIERNIEMHEKEISRQTNFFQEVIYSNQRQMKILDKEIDTLKKIFTCETTVSEKIIQKLLIEKEQLLEMIRELELTLKVPRMHYKFIEQHGVHEFVKQCMLILEKDNIREQQEQQVKNRQNERKAGSIDKFLRNMKKDKTAKNNQVIANAPSIKYNMTKQELRVDPSFQTNELEAKVKHMKGHGSGKRSTSFVNSSYQSNSTMVSPSHISTQKLKFGFGNDLLLGTSSAMLQIESKGTLTNVFTNKNSLKLLND